MTPSGAASLDGKVKARVGGQVRALMLSFMGAAPREHLPGEDWPNSKVNARFQTGS